MTRDAGYCQCGCGEKTVVSPVTDRSHGWTKGEPRRFLAGHNNHLRRAGHEVVFCGYETACWLWLGRLNERGYGRASKGPAHVDYYERFVGPVADGMELDHLCRQRRCVNPEHLEPVTHAENIRRGYAARPGVSNAPLAAAIREGRRALQMTQRELAGLIGVSQALVGQWERGAWSPPAARIAAMQAVLGRDLAEYSGPAEREPAEMTTYGGTRA